MNYRRKPFRSSYRGPKNRRKSENRKKIIAAAVGTVLVIGIAAAVLFRKAPEREAQGTAAEIAAETEKRLTITVNGNSLDDMSREEAKREIAGWYPWNMQAAFGDETAVLDNPLETLIDQFVDRIFEEGSGDYTLEFDGLEEAAVRVAAAYAEEWDIKPKDSALDHFDKETGKFVFSEGCSGTAVNQEKLSQDIVEAVKAGQLDAVLDVELLKIAPELSMDEAKERYKTLAAFTTETTNNPKRNTNVRLAAEALNGTIVQPGEEFSFNSVVGQRTAEKGYQEAAAYNSGEVVQEVGGGVCQISSTLYRVVFQSGMTITYRRSHTFEPNYVTPGQDAAISWELPDFRFINESEGPVGIRASYSDRKATVSIFGIPVLEEGISWDLDSEKVEELDPPEPEYVEDSTLPPGTEKVQKAATPGSRWVTYKVISKDGAEIERVEDHEKTYKGHAAVIRRNTSTVQETPEETGQTAPAEGTSPEGSGQPESGAQGNQPGGGVQGTQPGSGQAGSGAQGSQPGGGQAGSGAQGSQPGGGQAGSGAQGNQPGGGQAESTGSGSSTGGANQAENPGSAESSAPVQDQSPVETIAPFIY